jgi:hypothetical protein
MEHGDSVAIPLTEKDRARKTGGTVAQNAAIMWIRRHRPGWKAVARREGTDRVRIWFVDPSRPA